MTSPHTPKPHSCRISKVPGQLPMRSRAAQLRLPVFAPTCCASRTRRREHPAMSTQAELPIGAWMAEGSAVGLIYLFYTPPIGRASRLPFSVFLGLPPHKLLNAFDMVIDDGANEQPRSEPSGIAVRL